MKEEYYNPASKRKNPLRSVYNDPCFKNVLEARDSMAKYPFLVDLEVTNHCNLSCIFCGQRLMTRKKGYMSYDVFKKVIDECDSHNTPVRLIRWGEPFLHPDIMKFVEYVKTKKRIPLHITTNGLCLDEARIKKLVDLKLDSICFSFQGATKARYEVMRQNKKYDQLKAVILKLVETRKDSEQPYIHVSTTVTDETEAEIDDFTGSWSSIADLVTVGKTNLTKMMLLRDENADKCREIEALLAQETIKKAHVPCKEIYQKLSVNYDGTASACCTDFDNHMLVGDVNTDTIENIWNNSKRLNAFRALLDDKQFASLTLCRACYPTTTV